MKDVRAIYFVREFTGKYEPERKAFFSRPKLDGLWVRLTFLDHETLEGVVPNDLLALLDSGVQITPPDLNGAAVRIYVPRSALAELTVLGVVGVARREASTRRRRRSPNSSRNRARSSLHLAFRGCADRVQHLAANGVE